ncbi:MAG: hypothetical protein GTO02_11005 [Candidatus Dadabacteria bacterium]|nr:hypothetical protein [Candidatus Dadabacteria bacterium]
MSNLPRAKVKWNFYWKEFLFVALAWSAPLITWIVTQPPERAEWLARSGSLMVLFSVIGEYYLQKKNAVKFINNAIRAGTGTAPLDFSVMAVVANILFLITVVLGTIIWGYGDKIF